jgi:hypothetical protein
MHINLLQAFYFILYILLSLSVSLYCYSHLFFFRILFFFFSFFLIIYFILNSSSILLEICFARKIHEFFILIRQFHSLILIFYLFIFKLDDQCARLSNVWTSVLSAVYLRANFFLIKFLFFCFLN